ncbi:hypothetical protein Tsubulata_045873, partial [Turnera subulata]
LASLLFNPYRTILYILILPLLVGLCDEVDKVARNLLRFHFGGIKNFFGCLGYTLSSQEGWWFGFATHRTGWRFVTKLGSEAFLAKLAWRFVTKPNLLWVRLVWYNFFADQVFISGKIHSFRG